MRLMHLDEFPRNRGIFPLSRSKATKADKMLAMAFTIIEPSHNVLACIYKKLFKDRKFAYKPSVFPYLVLFSF